MAIRTRQQLFDTGVTKRGLSKFDRLLPLIYATAKPDYVDLCTAVTLWRPDAVLSHATAAWLFDLVALQPSDVEVTVDQGEQCRGPSWVVFHRRPVTSSTWVNGLPIVTIERTLLDIAVDMEHAALQALFDAAIGKQVNMRAVAMMCCGAKGMHGIRAVEEQLRTCCPLTRSEPERMVARALSARNFPLEINAKIGRYYGDLVCRRARVIVEIDGREFHIEPGQFNNDRKRQNELIDDDWRILRYSAVTAMANLDDVVDEIIRVVRKRRRSRRA